MSPWRLPPSLTSVPDQNGVPVGRYSPFLCQVKCGATLPFLLGAEAPSAVSSVAVCLPLAHWEGEVWLTGGACLHVGNRAFLLQHG